MNASDFWLGTHHPQWLAFPAFEDMPLFISRQSLKDRRKLPRARGRWALDSSGFTQLKMYGRWTFTPRAYVAEVRRFRDEIGNLAWAAPQDWMCEPVVITGGKTKDGAFAGTGLSVEEHQRLTVANYLELRSIAPEFPFIPVLQGWSTIDYWRCAELYQAAGIELADEPLVGVGSVCRRQGKLSASTILSTLACDGLRLHGFGFKTDGLLACSKDLASADSMAWSYNGRRHPPIPGHDRPGPGRPKGHKNCANCPEHAIQWRADLLERLAGRMERAA